MPVYIHTAYFDNDVELPIRITYHQTSRACRASRLDPGCGAEYDLAKLEIPTKVDPALGHWVEVTEAPSLWAYLEAQLTDGDLHEKLDLDYADWDQDQRAAAADMRYRELREDREEREAMYGRKAHLMPWSGSIEDKGDD
jgi:hypothetical protein